MIQIRNVPEDVHRTMKARAAAAGLSLSDYLLEEIRRVAQRPTMAEMVARLEALPPAAPVLDTVEILREDRERR